MNYLKPLNPNKMLTKKKHAYILSENLRIKKEAAKLRWNSNEQITRKIR